MSVEEKARELAREMNYSSLYEAEIEDLAVVPAYKAGHASRDEEVGRLRREVFRLRKAKEYQDEEVRRLREALEFYASDDSWYRLEETSSIITDTDLRKPDRESYDGQLVGGKRAREALKGGSDDKTG